ncbi:MAG: hypothetical protein ACTHMS_19830 [Jatrophihabitans sp.]|uniref:hypothetical protein n=1 Tax=Jatrophihabitans sp. TaxID=1932789 RepID=UPI003F7EE5DE
MAREGMDVDVVEAAGNQMKQIGTDGLPHLINAIEGLIQRTQGAWWGHDAQAFAQAWHSNFKPALSRIAGEVANHGQLALTNVNEQRQASAGTSIA